MEHPEWYYDGSRSWMKVLRFCNLLEDDFPRLSVTKLGLWATTVQTICMALFSADPVSVGVSAMNSLGWLVGHRVAQAQKARGIK